MDAQELREVLEKSVIEAALESKAPSSSYARDAMILATKAIAQQDEDEWLAARDGLVIGLAFLLGAIATDQAEDVQKETIQKLRHMCRIARENMSLAEVE